MLSFWGGVAKLTVFIGGVCIHAHIILLRQRLSQYFFPVFGTQDSNYILGEEEFGRTRSQTRKISESGVDEEAKKPAVKRTSTMAQTAKVLFPDTPFPSPSPSDLNRAWVPFMLYKFPSLMFLPFLCCVCVCC